MKIIGFIIVLICAGISYGIGDVPSVNNGKQIVRVALVIGSDIGGTEQQALKYAVKDAVTIAEVLKQIGGIEQSHLFLIKNPNRWVLSEYLNRCARICDSPPGGTGQKEVIVYYSGHADQDGILLAGERFFYRDLRQSLDKMNAGVKIGIIDACGSGAMTRLKGGIARPPFLFDASSDLNGHVYLTSSSIDEASQESDFLKGSFFTYNLIAALRGAADSNGDRKITLNEAYQYAFNETLKRTELTLSGPQHAHCEINLKGSGDLVITDLRLSNCAMQIDQSVAGNLFVRDANGNLIMEIKKSAGKPIALGVEPGNYKVILENEGTASKASLNITERSQVSLTKDNFTPIAMPTGYSGKSKGAAREDRLYDTVPISFSIVPNIRWRLGRLQGERTLHYASINLVGNNYCLQQGVSIGSIWECAVDGITGAQIAGVVCIDNGWLRGAQIAGVWSHTQGGANGFQIAGVANTAFNYFEGAQIAGTCNIGNRVRGVQCAGVLNKALSVEGCQIAGAINLANSVNDFQIGTVNICNTIKGLQIGTINYAAMCNGVQVGVINILDSNQGIPLGLFSFVKHHLPHGVVWTDESGDLFLGIKTGTDFGYSRLGIGIDSRRGVSKSLAQCGLGLSFPTGPIRTGAEVSFLQRIDRMWNEKHPEEYIGKLRAVFSYSIYPRLSVFLSPGITFYWGDGNPNDYSMGGVQHLGKQSSYKRCWWPGCAGGIEF